MQLIWLFKHLILIILTLTKCLQNLLRDSTLSVISIAKNFLFQVVSMILKMSIIYFFIYHPISQKPNWTRNSGKNSAFCRTKNVHTKKPIHAFFFIRTTNLNLSLGVLKFLAYFRLKSSYFVLNFFMNNKCYLLQILLVYYQNHVYSK